MPAGCGRCRSWVRSGSDVRPPSGPGSSHSPGPWMTSRTSPSRGREPTWGESMTMRSPGSAGIAGLGARPTGDTVGLGGVAARREGLPLGLRNSSRRATRRGLLRCGLLRCGLLRCGLLRRHGHTPCSAQSNDLHANYILQGSSEQEDRGCGKLRRIYKADGAPIRCKTSCLLRTRIEQSTENAIVLRPLRNCVPTNPTRPSGQDRKRYVRDGAAQDPSTCCPSSSFPRGAYR
jgi:hypothetical protein